MGVDERCSSCVYISRWFWVASLQGKDDLEGAGAYSGDLQW